MPAIKRSKMFGTRCKTDSLCHVSNWSVSCPSCRWLISGNPEEMSVGYIFNNPECGDGLEIHTVREWFHDFNIPLKDDYFFTWTKTQATLCKHLRFLEEHLSENTMLQIWNAILISLYLYYEITEDFQTQFKKNSDAILSLIETLKILTSLCLRKHKQPQILRAAQFGRLFFISI